MQKLYRTLSEMLLEQHHRWILWLPVFMATGIGVYFSLHAEPSIYMGAFISVCLLVFLLSAWRNMAARLCLMVIFFISLGFAMASVRTQQVYTPIFKKEIGPVMIEGDVTQIDHEPSSIKIIIENAALEDISVSDTPRRIRLKLAARFGVPELGDRIKVLGILLPPSPPVSPFSYDFQRHMYFQGIGATGYIVRDFEVVGKADDIKAVQVLDAESYREKVKKRIQAAEGSQNAKAVLVALLTGERRMIPESVWEDIRKAGIAHLLAISGLHIGLIAGFAFFILRAFLAAIPVIALKLPVKKMAAVFAFIMALSYCWLIGGSIPAQRAVLMTGIVLFAVMIDRVAISLRLAAFAALVILMIAPESLFTPSFQMSFAAVVSLISFYEVFRSKYVQVFYGYSIPKRISVYLLATFLTSVVASVATAPFALYHFQRVAMLPGLLANMIAVPMTAFVVMPSGFLALLAMPFGGEGLLLKVAFYGIDVIIDVANWTANMRGSVWQSTIWPQSALVLVVLGALWMCIWQGRLRLLGIPFLLAGIGLSINVGLPNILISPEGKQVAIYDPPHTLVFKSRRAERFTREMWQGEYGGIDPVYWPKEGRLDAVDLVCDSWGCIYKYGESIIALPKDEMALYEDCKRADLIIAPMFYELPQICKGMNLISRKDLKEEGGHAIYFEDGGYRVETVYDVRGDRPWTASNN